MPEGLRIEALAQVLHNESGLSRFGVLWTDLPAEAHDAYRAQARRYAATLQGVVASEVVDRGDGY